MGINKTRVLAKISKYSGFTSLCYYLNRDRKRVIAYHNVIIDSLFDNSIHLDYSIKESDFKKQLEIIKDRFKIDLNLEDPNSVTVTFDDGYLNQYLIASKLLDEINAKGIFFFAEDLINNNRTLGMDLLEFWISYVGDSKYYLKEVDLNLNLKKDNRREEFKKISDKLLEGEVTLNQMVKSVDNAYSMDKIIKGHKELYELRLKGIDKNQIDKMKSKGHKIGAHSSKHNRLSNLSFEELKEDIRLCKNEVSGIYNTEIFCYPYGSEEDISEEVINQLKGNGFTKAFLYGNFPLKKFEYNKYLMPRMVLPSTGDEDLIHFTLSGAKNMILFRKKLPKL